MSKKITAMDGNTAAGYVGYMMSEIAAIYPITPSSPMAEYGDELAASNKKNIFGRIVKFAELQSEGGAAGAVHGSLAAGAMTTTYTASQGLLLMIPNMYKIAGEKLPSVFHVSARTIASHALSIFGDHSDVMATRQTGFIMLASNNSQEVMYLAFISHVATYKAHLPILHFFDGFRTSHEITKVEILEDELMRSMLPLKEIEKFRQNAHNPAHPKQTGTAQNSDIFFQATEASNQYYDAAYGIVASVMEEFATKTGRTYKPFQYVGDANATDIIVLMGSGCDTVEETVNYLNKNGSKVGVLKVRLYRPFQAKAFLAALPKSVQRISVLDRTKEHGSLGEPLYLDVMAALVENNRSDIKCYAGRYGLACKEFTPTEVYSVFENMQQAQPKNHFTVGIVDDVTHLSLPVSAKFKGLNSQYYEMKFYGLGSDGTVSANKSSIKIIGELTPKYVQGYFEYDSKKSGSLTTSHLRVSDQSFYTPYLVKHADFIAVHNYAFISQYDVLDGLKSGGCVLLNTSLTDEQLARDLPETFKKHLAESKAKMFVIPAFDVAKAAGLGNRINVIMQACFFKISNIIPYAKAEEEMKKFATKAYGKKGEKILAANMKAIDSATTDLREVDVNKIISTKTESFTQTRQMSNYFKN
jgi:pyruvate-ferredoxin/flavodoxin oxidoreductase